MPPIIKKITSWSFSRYSAYVGCAFKAKLKFIDKLPEPGNDAMARGSAIGKMAEDYVKGAIARLPKELKAFEAEFKKLKAMYKKGSKLLPMTVEDTWAFRADWTQTVWNDWNGCRARIKIDVGHFEDENTYVVTDWKTGKFRPEKNAEYLEQLELYALGALLKYEAMDLTIKVRLGYLDQGIMYTGEGDTELTYTLKDLPGLKKLWEKRTKPMLADTRFAPKPSNLCRWCHFGQSGVANGGPGRCKF